MKLPALRFSEFEGEWRPTTLGQESECLDNKRVPLEKGDRAKRSGPYPYYGASGVIDYIDDFIFDGELVLLGEDGANIINRNSPLAFLAAGKFWVNNHAHVYRANGSNEFLATYLENLRYEKYNTGTAQPKLNGEVCKKLKLNFPSLPEQKKIAAFLGVVDAKIAALRARVAGLERYKRGLMQALFSQTLRFTKEDGISFPDWERIAADQLFLSVSNKKHGGDLPILAITQEHGAILREDIDIDIKATASSVASYKIVEPGDFIISLRSFQGGIEYSSVLGICSPAYTVLKPTKPIADPFFKYFFKDADFISRLSATVVGIREGKQISYSAFGTLTLPYPHPDEQAKIADTLSAMEAKIAAVTGQLERMQDFKKSLLQQMFV